MSAAGASCREGRTGGTLAEGTGMHDELLGSTHPILSISLEPGESVFGAASQFAWMTDSIRMTSDDEDRKDELELSVYTATRTAGVVAFAASRPGCVIGVEAADGYLISGSGFVAGGSGVRVRPARGQGLPLWQLTGSGRAWIGLGGDVVERELTAGQSLRAQRDHVGMLVPTITSQVTEVQGICVLSGPGTVWLQSRSGNHEHR
jgi:uncharacterized protein (AIM24 family)